jgi:hypothetical protein
MDCLRLAQDMAQWQAIVEIKMNLQVICKVENLLITTSYKFLKRVSTIGVNLCMTYISLLE